ncbi:YoaK family protein [Methylopila sp. M107]|uniref:YoaK family protein n=1 Tax=Methylopila sp. M107 TaxID=1101190 RepID=UPI0003604930|nr:YoaK family protein [Methylopila sp. M107]
MKTLLLILLAFNAGYVDAAGFLALHGLFTTHVTGNFVTLGASLALGTTGVLAKVLALPLFCLVILLARLVGIWFDRLGWPALRIFFVAQAAFLTGAASLAIRHGAFPNGDAPEALAMGGLLVAAMAIQNAVHRVRLTDMPPSTVMTGTTTQVMVDLADLMRGVSPEKRAAAKKRLGPMSISVAAFATGCGAGALGFVFGHEICFAIPPVLVLAAMGVDALRSRA